MLIKQLLKNCWLGFSALMAKVPDAPFHSQDPRREQHSHVLGVQAWECQTCYELHLEEEDALECCPSTLGLLPDEFPSWICNGCGEIHKTLVGANKCCPLTATQLDANSCPICAQVYNSPRDASDCCLWKDLALPARWGVADRVEDGSTWPAELEALAAQARMVH